MQGPIMNPVHLAKLSLGVIYRLRIVQDIKVRYALADVTYVTVLAENMLVESSDIARHGAALIIQAELSKSGMNAGLPMLVR